MAWTTPVTWAVNQLVSASDMNQQVSGNLNYLFKERAKGVLKAANTGLYTTTAQAWAPIDATNLNMVLTVQSGILLFGFTTACVSLDSGTNYQQAFFDVVINGINYSSGSTSGLAVSPATAGVGSLSFTGLATGLPTTPISLFPVWKTFASNTQSAIASSNNYRTVFWAVEVG